MSVVVIDQQPAGESNWDEDRVGKSSKWDHHLSLAVLVTVLSVFALNIFGLFCGVAGIFFAYKVSMPPFEIDRFTANCDIGWGSSFSCLSFFLF